MPLWALTRGLGAYAKTIDGPQVFIGQTCLFIIGIGRCFFFMLISC